MEISFLSSPSKSGPDLDAMMHMEPLEPEKPSYHRDSSTSSSHDNLRLPPESPKFNLHVFQLPWMASWTLFCELLPQLSSSKANDWTNMWLDAHGKQSTLIPFALNGFHPMVYLFDWIFSRPRIDNRLEIILHTVASTLLKRTALPVLFMSLPSDSRHKPILFQCMLSSPPQLALATDIVKIHRIAMYQWYGNETLLVCAARHKRCDWIRWIAQHTERNENIVSRWTDSSVHCTLMHHLMAARDHRSLRLIAKHLTQQQFTVDTSTAVGLLSQTGYFAERCVLLLMRYRTSVLVQALKLQTNGFLRISNLLVRLFGERQPTGDHMASVELAVEIVRYGSLCANAQWRQQYRNAIAQVSAHWCGTLPIQMHNHEGAVIQGPSALVDPTLFGVFESQRWNLPAERFVDILPNLHVVSGTRAAIALPSVDAPVMVGIHTPTDIRLNFTVPSRQQPYHARMVQVDPVWMTTLPQVHFPDELGAGAGVSKAWLLAFADWAAAHTGGDLLVEFGHASRRPLYDFSEKADVNACRLLGRVTALLFLNQFQLPYELAHPVWLELTQALSLDVPHYDEHILYAAECMYPERFEREWLPLQTKSVAEVERALNRELAFESPDEKSASAERVTDSTKLAYLRHTYRQLTVRRAVAPRRAFIKGMQELLMASSPTKLSRLLRHVVSSVSSLSACGRLFAACQPVTAADMKLWIVFRSEESKVDKSPYVQRFWRVFERLSTLQVSQLFEFVTSLRTRPASANRPCITVEWQTDPRWTKQLPEARTCTFVLMMGMYETDERMLWALETIAANCTCVFRFL